LKTVIIVQARMTSTRLPGKVLRTVLGKTLLEYQVERLQRVTLKDEIVIATTINRSDRPIIDLCERLGIPWQRGSEEDVLSRYCETARSHGADIIVRVTSDCPVIDPAVIDKVVRYYLDHRDQYDYVSNTLVRTYPRGMDTEVFSMHLLETAYHEATSPGDREHVTPFFYRQPRRYRLQAVMNDRDYSGYRWTVDTPEDFALIEQIIEMIYPGNPCFGMDDVIRLLDRHPELSMINAHIEQKKVDG
jgi:spore coat polysaccharide biosynthesis protein SpsF